MESPSDMSEAWYEITLVVEGSLVDTWMLVDLSVAKDHADDLAAQHAADQDIGSWEVYLSPHWCKGTSECSCSQFWASLKPYKASKGMVIPE